MGYMRHHAIVVTSWDEKKLDAAGAAAVASGCTVTDIGAEVTNGYRSFLVCPDGSKEGWDQSNQGDSARAEFIMYLREQEYDDGSSSLDWVEIQFGDDNLETRVIDDSDRLRRAKYREQEGVAL